MKILRDYFSKIGKRGGEATKRRHSKSYYAEIGAKGNESKKRKKAKLLVNKYTELPE